MDFINDINLPDVRFLDVLDILIVAFLIYQLFRLLRGSIGLNIFIGLILVYAAWWLVRILEMNLLSSFLGQFVSLGVILLVIVFQPEVRRFLLLLGNTLRQRSSFLNRLLKDSSEKSSAFQDQTVEAVHQAIMKLSQSKTGALIVFGEEQDIQNLQNSGIPIDARISLGLIQSIFNKTSPLHDGAMLLTNGRIHSARVILPLSSNEDLPPELGLRHRAAVGLSEVTNMSVFLISEQSGSIAFSHQGNLINNLSETEVKDLITEHYC